VTDPSRHFRLNG